MPSQGVEIVEGIEAYDVAQRQLVGRECREDSSVPQQRRAFVPIGNEQQQRGEGYRLKSRPEPRTPRRPRGYLRPVAQRRMLPIHGFMPDLGLPGGFCEQPNSFGLHGSPAGTKPAAVSGRRLTFCFGGIS